MIVSNIVSTNNYFCIAFAPKLCGNQHSRVHLRTRARTQTHTHIHTHTHTLAGAHTHTHTHTPNQSLVCARARAHTDTITERERHTHTRQPPGRSTDRYVDSKGLAQTVHTPPERASPPEQACRLHESKVSVDVGIDFASRSCFGRLSFCRCCECASSHALLYPLFPAAVARHHLPPPHATRIWNSSS